MTTRFKNKLNLNKPLQINNKHFPIKFADSSHCEEQLALGSAMCFSMTIPADIESLDIESAQLWVYKQPHITDTNVNFLISEVQTWKSSRVVKPFAIQDTNATGNLNNDTICHF